MCALKSGSLTWLVCHLSIHRHTMREMDVWLLSGAWQTLACMSSHHVVDLLFGRKHPCCSLLQGLGNKLHDHVQHKLGWLPM